MYFHDFDVSADGRSSVPRRALRCPTRLDVIVTGSGTDEASPRGKNNSIRLSHNTRWIAL